MPSRSPGSHQQLQASSPQLNTGHDVPGSGKSPGHLGSAVLALLPLSSLCTCSLPQPEDLSSPWLQVSPAQHQPRCPCGVSIVLRTPKCSTAPAASRKIASLPAETGTALHPHCWMAEIFALLPFCSENSNRIWCGNTKAKLGVTTVTSSSCLV